ncbi:MULTISPECIES: hypothetical protein [Nocardia]|nr:MULTISPECIES: hypothetical protein [Nocardia]
MNAQERDRELMMLIKKPNLTKAEKERLIELNKARMAARREGKK